MTKSAKSEPRRIIADGFKIAICPVQGSVADLQAPGLLLFRYFFPQWFMHIS
jgi:hypothetical protein